MKTLSIPVLLFFILLTHLQGQQEPFSLTIVPHSRSSDLAWIDSGKDSTRTFFVILKNNTAKPQAVFEQWNSWGYKTISFQMSLPEGRKVKVTMRDRGFTMNFPATYVIPAKGYQVFPIVFDQEWSLPTFEKARLTKIKLKAIYSVDSTDESTVQKVWVGEVESEAITVELKHW
jgi:hypothetical protein